MVICTNGSFAATSTSQSSAPAERQQRVVSETLSSDQIFFIGSMETNIDTDTIDFENALGLPLILTSQVHSLRREIDLLAKKRALKINIRCEVDSRYPPSRTWLLRAMGTLFCRFGSFGMNWTTDSCAACALSIRNRREICSSRCPRASQAHR